MIRLCIFILLFSTSLYAEEYYLKPKYYFDSESGKMIANKIIGVKDGVVSYIGETLPRNAKLYNLKSEYLLPGFFDCHTHVLFSQRLEDVDLENALMREVKIPDEERIKRAKIFLIQYLQEGFTSLCDLGNSGKFLDVELRERIHGDAKFPDLFVSGPGIATRQAQFRLGVPREMVEKEYTIIDDHVDVQQLLKPYLEKKVDILKLYLDNSPGIGRMNDETIDKILKSPLIKKFKKITFHAVEKDSINVLLKQERFSIEHGSAIDWGLLNKKKEIYLTLTDQPESILKEFNYYSKVFYLSQIARAKDSYKKGINLVFGTDFYFNKDTVGFNRGLYAKSSVDAWSEARIPPVDILRALTFNAAKSMGLQSTFGVIKIGSRANLIGVSINPLLDINSLKKIEFVMNKGVIVKDINLSKLQKKI